MGDIIVIIALVLCIGAAVTALIVNRKRGSKCHGCPYEKGGSGCHCAKGLTGDSDCTK